MWTGKPNKNDIRTDRRTEGQADRPKKKYSYSDFQLSRYMDWYTKQQQQQKDQQLQRQQQLQQLQKQRQSEILQLREE